MIQNNFGNKLCLIYIIVNEKKNDIQNKYNFKKTFLYKLELEPGSLAYHASKLLFHIKQGIQGLNPSPSKRFSLEIITVEPIQLLYLIYIASEQTSVRI